MRRSIALLGLCVVLLGSSALTAFAGPILINALTKGQDILVDASIKDGDLVQALTTLFNQTGYQLRIGPSVSGTVANLQFTKEPFESALKQMITSVNPNYKLEKVDATFYRIDSGDTTDIKLPSAKPSAAKADDAKKDAIKIIKVKLPPVKKTTTTGTTPTSGATPPGIPGLPGSPAAGGDTTASKPAEEAEDCYIALVTINNLDLYSLCNQFGTDIAQFIPPMMSSSSSSGSNGISNGYGNNGYNNGINSGYGNNGYNNGTNNGYGNTGYNNGYNNSGYNNGNNTGYNNGYNNGYSNNGYNNNNSNLNNTNRRY